jgi:hypothetical protein
MDIENSIDAVRKWQRHHLLRQYGEDGQVLPENIVLSGHIERIIAAIPRFTKEEEDEMEPRYSGPNLSDPPMRR